MIPGQLEVSRLLATFRQGRKKRDADDRAFPVARRYCGKWQIDRATIAKEMAITPERVRQLEAIAVRTIKFALARDSAAVDEIRSRYPRLHRRIFDNVTDDRS